MATTYHQIYVQAVFAVKYRAAVLNKLMKDVKGKSSRYINDHHFTGRHVNWQDGYGVFSYRQRDIDQIFKYIQNQEEHHRIKTFKEEYLELLKEFEINYDEQYIF